MSINQHNKAVIFDMDGVVFDSERAVYKGWKELAEKYDVELMQNGGVYTQLVSNE